MKKKEKFDWFRGLGGSSPSKGPMLQPQKKVKNKNKEKEYKDLAHCIKMGQVSSDRIQKHFVKDPKFEKWYIKNALNKSLFIE